MNEWDTLLLTFRNHGRSIIVGMIVGVVVATFIVLFQKPVWEGIMIVVPTERAGVPSLSSFLPKAAADAPALQYFVERIDASQSTDFNMFETLIIAPSIVAQIDGALLPKGDAYLWLKKNLKIRPVGMTQFRKITLRGTDKNVLPLILMALYDHADKEIRQDKKMRTARRIAYLNQQLKIVQNPDHRDAIIALLKEQEQIAMMVSIDNEFAADIIEPPYISYKPVAPNGMILFPALIFCGAVIGFLYSGLRQSIRQ